MTVEHWQATLPENDGASQGKDRLRSKKRLKRVGEIYAADVGNRTVAAKV